MKNLFKALASFQQECPTVKKTKNNDFGKFKYTDLADVVEVAKPLLQKHGLGYYQVMDMQVLRTVLFHVESGETIESAVEMPQGIVLKGMNEFQVMGSSISYIRKYQLTAILGIVSDEKSIDSLLPQEPRKKQPISVDRFEKALVAIQEGKAKKEDLLKFDLTEVQQSALNLL